MILFAEISRLFQSNYLCAMNLRPLLLHHECEFKSTRSGGKGGQHVNKVSSRVELYFNIAASNLLSEEQKNILLEKLAPRLSDEGILRLTEDSSRSQYDNRKRIIEKFYALLENALKPVKKRVETKIPKMLKEKRLQKKKKHSEKKRLRKPGLDWRST